MDRFHEHFGLVPDPRAENAKHDLVEILFIAFLAVLCGATNCSEMAEFGLAKEALLRQILTLKHGIPSHDTFTRVFRMLDPTRFEEAFRRFTLDFVASVKGVVAIDGKALRRAYERGQSHMPKMMVTAFGAATRMVLASAEAAGGNEAETALLLLEMLNLKGCVVTTDALHCHRGLAKAILARGGDYALAVKGNQPALLRDAKAAIAAGTGAKTAATNENSHDRKEERIATVVPAGIIGLVRDFPGLAAIGCIISQRGQEKPLERYFLLSKKVGPERLLAISRSHWDIENGLHWALDVTLDEDAARNRKDNAPANLAILRRLALNVARHHPDTKTSLRRKLLRAGWDENYLFDLIRHMR